MLATHPHKQRTFRDAHEPDAMMNKNTRQSKFVSSAIGEDPALMLGHRLVCLIINAVDLAPIFHRSHHSSKINHRTGIKIDSELLRCRFFQSLLG